ncbi:MAG TPA: HepT-like ribonuclease domain-containing protein, partial [Thermoanaerobaculia bacterium]|nr:HepT-like ribonuclease domain-containing protein [Thermoanaerobaculia bacterium]
DNADVFRSLRESGVIDGDLADRLEGMARFRNLLIHVYADVDDRRVHEFLQTDLEDLRRLARAILGLV